MGRIFRISEENTVARCYHRARISTVRSGLSGLPDESSGGRFASRTPEGLLGKRLPSRIHLKRLNDTDKPQPSELGLLRPGRRRADLAVLAPRRPALLAGTQNHCVQTIPFKPDAL